MYPTSVLQSETCRPGHQHVPCSHYATVGTKEGSRTLPQLQLAVNLTAQVDMQGGQHHPGSPGAVPQRSPMPSSQVGG